MSFGGKRRGLTLCALALLLLAAACSAKSDGGQTATSGPPGTNAAATPNTPVSASDATVRTGPNQDGVQHLKFTFGPIAIKPGQNNITISDGQVDKPKVDGYIVGIHPNLYRDDGSVPPVDIIHLHHGVWLNLAAKDPTSPRLPERFFASGEEKTSMYLPTGYGYPYKATDPWIINYMLHNLLSTPDSVSIVYDLDFVPADAPAAKTMKAARPIWMDVQNGSTYPVFDVIKGSGQNGLYTYPTDATDPYKGRQPKNEWTVDRDSVIVGTAGHLHPGGLRTDLYVTRDGATASSDAAAAVKGSTAHLFESTATYYEPAGAVSWDVAMSVTGDDYRVSVKKGDVLSTTATYDSKRASWYESMGIMVTWFADADVAAGEGVDPFQARVDKPGQLTHGHLAENDNHGGNDAAGKFVDMTKLPNGAVGDTVTIADFAYAPGDMSGIYTDVPTVKAGQSLKFLNKDAPLDNGIWHTITACKEPCDKATGVAYPLADADVQFDSGELGVAGPPTAGRVDWSIPTDLPSGTYTYFCRIHPSMRGAFRVDGQ